MASLLPRAGASSLWPCLTPCDWVSPRCMACVAGRPPVTPRRCPSPWAPVVGRAMPGRHHLTAPHTIPHGRPQ
eukprot:2873169-Alexandrium_andersonii.AAC.1